VTEQELDKLAELLAEKVHKSKHNFWIDGEKHYKEHAKLEPLTDKHIQALVEFATAYQSAKGSIVKTILVGLALCGILIGAAAWSSLSKLWP